MIVEFKRKDASVLTVPFRGVRGKSYFLKLVRGTNEVPDDKWAVARNYAKIKHYIKNGLIVEVGAKEVKKLKKDPNLLSFAEFESSIKGQEHKGGGVYTVSVSLPDAGDGEIRVPKTNAEDAVKGAYAVYCERSGAGKKEMERSLETTQLPDLPESEAIRLVNGCNLVDTLVGWKDTHGVKLSDTVSYEIQKRIDALKDAKKGKAEKK